MYAPQNWFWIVGVDETRMVKRSGRLRHGMGQQARGAHCLGAAA